MTARVVTIPEESGLPYRLGRSIEHDERSKAFRAVTAPVELRNRLHRRWGPLLDQNGIGACTYFGLLACAHHRPLYRTGVRYTNDDGFDGYGRATEIDPFAGTFTWPPAGGQDTGSSGLAACKVGVERGVITRYDHAFGLDQTLQATVNSTVMVGTVWKESMFDLSTSGIIECRGADVGGHLYALTGIDVDRELVRIHCAWLRWGVKGQQWAWMRWRDLGPLLEDRGDAQVPRRI
jgi:hypothetical protein